MKYSNILKLKDRNEFRKWLSINHDKEKECYISLNRGKPINPKRFYYLDAIEEALCFGWIDSTIRIINGKQMQRFSPRRKDANWTELNKERARRLIKLGLMNEAGYKVLPSLDIRSFHINKEIENELKKAKALSKFKMLPPLYQRIRASNLMFYKKRHPESYKKMLNHTITTAKQGKTFGEWNDYGRLLNY